jgi:hypothetical protein
MTPASVSLELYRDLGPHHFDHRAKAVNLRRLVARRKTSATPFKSPLWQHDPGFCFSLGSHDKRRIASTIGIDQARVAAMLLFRLPSTPIFHAGDGTPNPARAGARPF